VAAATAETMSATAAETTSATAKSAVRSTAMLREQGRTDRKENNQEE
jgi:hypothetical protein